MLNVVVTRFALTKPIRFGVALHNFTTAAEDPDLRAIVRYAVLAEELNLDSVYAWDHMLLGSRTPFPVLDALITLAAVAIETKRVRLGTGVLVLPLRNPVVLAKQTATIDRLSNGRLTLGVGVGWYRKEFDAVGIDHGNRAAIFLTNLRLLYQLWSGQALNGEDLPYRFKNVLMLPTPIQQPRPEVLIGGYVEPVLKRVPRHSDGWLNYLYTAASFARSWNRIRQHAIDFGRDPDELTNVSQLPICIADTFREADERIKSFLAANVDLPSWSDCSVESSIRGTPEDCAEQLAEHIKAGVQHFVFIPYEYSTDQLRAIATGVVPKLRNGSAA